MRNEHIFVSVCLEFFNDSSFAPVVKDDFIYLQGLVYCEDRQCRTGRFLIDDENYSAVAVLLQSGREYQTLGSPNRETRVQKTFGLMNCAVKGDSYRFRDNNFFKGDSYKIVVLGAAVPCVLDTKIGS